MYSLRIPLSIHGSLASRLIIVVIPVSGLHRYLRLHIPHHTFQSAIIHLLITGIQIVGSPTENHILIVLHQSLTLPGLKYRNQIEEDQERRRKNRRRNDLKNLSIRNQKVRRPLHQTQRNHEVKRSDHGRKEKIFRAKKGYHLHPTRTKTVLKRIKQSGRINKVRRKIGKIVFTYFSAAAFRLNVSFFHI